MTWLIIENVYFVVLILVCLRIIYDTRSNTKTLAYLLLAILVPVIGIFFYLFFGTNYRKRKIYTKKFINDEKLAARVKQNLIQYSENTIEQAGPIVQSNKELALLLLKDDASPLTANNNVKLLMNGEQKFPEVIEAISRAKHHIHIEYYIYEDDEIGQTIEKLLTQKSKEGVTVRFIYDDFGSRSIRKKMVKRLGSAGVRIFPFYKILFIKAANRLNYRNHRKIIVIDGETGFVGGINVSDKYINLKNKKEKLYWRDTHLRIDGPGVWYLQRLFLKDWNFCANDDLQPDESLFPMLNSFKVFGNKIVQIAASGPDSDKPTILFSLLQAINLAEKEILITTPYFIPGETIMDALVISAMGGVSVKLLVPDKSDSKIVNAAARFYYTELLEAGVEIYLYEKGFIHAKTMVIDNKMAIVGTANMDYRSFDLNFEVNAIVYNQETAKELAGIFYRDLECSQKLDKQSWENRPRYLQLVERIARLLSPLL